MVKAGEPQKCVALARVQVSSGMCTLAVFLRLRKAPLRVRLLLTRDVAFVVDPDGCREVWSGHKAKSESCLPHLDLRISQLGSASGPWVDLAMSWINNDIIAHHDVNIKSLTFPKSCDFFEENHRKLKMYPEYPPELNEEQKEYLLSNLKDWSIAHGLAVRPAPSYVPNDQDPSGALATTAPVTLFPSLFPRVCFEQAKSVAKAYNELYSSISSDEAWLKDIVEE